MKSMSLQPKKSPVEQEILKGYYIANRSDEFKKFISKLFSLGELSEKYTSCLLNDENMVYFGEAFTSELVDPQHNYEVWEQLGDLSLNKFTVQYFYDRFPQLRCAKGVKVAARLRINYASKESFQEIAERLGFWEFVTAPNDLRHHKKKSLLEDTFEAFFGVLEEVCNNNIAFGSGYKCVYKILKRIFDDMPISLKYEDLFDSITRLKELFDMSETVFEGRLGKLRYNNTRDETPDGLAKTEIYRVEKNGKETLIGTGSASLMKQSEKNAANVALTTLSRLGFTKQAPTIYREMEDNEVATTTKKNVLRIIENPEKINELFPTRGKSNNRTKYMSTALAFYCKQSDLEGAKICLEWKANPNVADCEGMYVGDFLCIGSKKFAKKIFEALSTKLKVNKNVFENCSWNVEKYKDRFEIVN